MSQKISVVGQGYVGLPLALSASEAGYQVIGIDSDLEKLKNLIAGQSRIEDIPDSRLLKCIKSGLYKPTKDFLEVSNCKIILICVPTPLTESSLPDLTAVKSAAQEIAKNLKKDSLVILESTVEPGTTRDILLPILLDGSGLNQKDIYVAFSPERTDPLNKIWDITNTPKIVAGLNEKSRDLAIKFYSKFITHLVPVDSLEIAETAKLLENSFRFINIAFINEFSLLCRRLNIDVNEVISAAATKPYGFMPFYPSVGVGGHCIPIDPLYLANKAKVLGISSRFIDLADEVNHEMASTFVNIAERQLDGLQNKRILVVGISYKSDTSDTRTTPVESLIIELRKKGAHVTWHDELVKEWNGEKSVELDSGYELAILATPHSYMDLMKLGDTPRLDTRGSI